MYMYSLGEYAHTDALGTAIGTVIAGPTGHLCIHEAHTSYFQYEYCSMIGRSWISVDVTMVTQ